MAAEDGGLGVRLLGPVRVSRGGEELALGSAHRQAVFAVLALNAGRTVTREDLVDAVWGEEAPTSATGNVYTYVSALRKVLEPGRGRWSAGQVLASGHGTYRLNLAEPAVDALRFEALREEGRRLRAAGDTDAELATVREALGLWRGEALSGIPGPYAAAQRSRLGELRLVTAERLAELLVERGDHDAAVAHLRPWAAGHPTRESLHGVLMAALHRAGRRTEALHVYAELAGRLVEESGTEPGPALRALRREVAADAAAPPVADRGPFVGRAAEVARLRAAVARAAAGRGGSLWIEGEPGAGRSALLSEGLRDAARLGCRVGWGLGDELAQRMRLGVLLECLDLDHDGEGGAALDTGGPVAAVLDRVVALARLLCGEAPLVLVVDDMQWADDLTLLAWRELHGLVAELPLLLVAACRPLPRSRELSLLRARQGREVVELPPLADADAAELVGLLRPGLTGPQVTALVRSAAGNPCYLRHLAAAAGDGPPTLAGELDAPSAALVAAVLGHLDLLSDDSREVLRALAFLGHDCGVAELAAATGRTGPELARAVAEAEAAGVLRAAGGHLRFRHPVVRTVLHDGTPAALRVTVHRAYAERLAGAGADPERVVRQLLAGPVPADEWVARWLVAHADAMSLRIPETAAAVLRQATAQSSLPYDLRESLTVALARLLFRRGAAADAEAGWVATRTADPERAAEMRWIVAATQHRRGEDEPAAGALRAALAAGRVPPGWQAPYRELLAEVTAAPPAPAPRSAAARHPVPG
jgi:DNA-binding SARP family transcriptional activator